LLGLHALIQNAWNVLGQTSAVGSFDTVIVNTTMPEIVSTLNNRTVVQVTLACLFNYNNPTGVARNYSTAIQIAIDEINRLVAYNREMYFTPLFINTNGTAAGAQQQLATLIGPSKSPSTPPITGIIGDFETLSSVAIATAINGLNIIQLSTTTLPSLDTIPNFLRLSPSDTAQADPLVDFAFFYNISSIGIIYSNDQYGNPLFQRVMNRTLSRGITVFGSAMVSYTSDISSATLTSSVTAALGSLTIPSTSFDVNMNRTSPHVIIVLLPTQTSTGTYIPFDIAFANAANSLKMLDPKNYITFLLSSQLQLSYKKPANADIASAASLLEYTVGVRAEVGVFKNDANLLAKLAVGQVDLLTRYYHDAVYVFAKSILGMLKRGADPNKPSKLTASVFATSFVGASGSVQFYANGERKLNRFAYTQTSSSYAQGDQIIGYWYPSQGFVPNNSTYRTDIMVYKGGAVSLPKSPPSGMPAYIPGYWQWTPLPYSGIPPPPRFGACQRASTVSDTLYVLSGTYSSAQAPYSDSYAYTFADQFWSAIPISGSFKPRSFFYGFCGLYDSGGFSSTPVNGLYNFAGVNSEGVKGELWRMDVDTYTWKNLAPTVIPSGANSISNSVSMDRAEGGMCQTSDFKVLIMGGFHRNQDQESILMMDLTKGDNLTFTSFTPYYNRYSFLQQNKDWYMTVPNSVNPVAEMAAAMVLDPNPILTSTPWTDPNSGKSYTLVFFIGGGLMPAGVALVYRVEDNTVFPFFHQNGTSVSSGNSAFPGLSGPARDISLTVSGNYHDGYIYVSDGWSDMNQVNYNDVWRLDVTCVIIPNAPCGNWTWLAAKPTETRDSYRPMIYGTDLVMFGGWGAKYIHNDLYTFSLIDNQFMNVGQDYTAPTGRELHSTCLVGNQMIVFGGRDTFQTAHNDVWLYDIDLGFWTLRTPTSPPPLARWGHSATSFNIAMYVFGGTNGIESFSDVWMFSLSTSAWTQLTSTGPSSRAYHTAVGYNEKEIIIYAGMDSNANILTEMWRYDINAMTWSQVFAGATDTYPIYSISSQGVATQIGQRQVCPNWGTPSYNGTCFPLVVSQAAAVVSGDIMYFIGGWDSAYNSQSQLCTINIGNYNPPPYNTKFTTSVPVPPAYATPALQYLVVSLQNPANYQWNCAKAPMPKSRNSLAAVISGDSIFVYGGTSFELMMSPLIVYSISLDSWTTISDTVSTHIPRPRAGTSAIVYGNRWMVFGGSMAALGTIHSATFLSNEHWQFVLGPACSTNSSVYSPLSSSSPTFGDCSPCTPGTVPSGTNCQSCPAGTYSSNGVCVQCSAGFYNPFKGANSQQYCLPCDNGFKNSKPGAASCVPCSGNEYCPVATVNGQVSNSAELQLSGQTQYQAQPLQSQANVVTDLGSQAAISLIACVGFCCALYLLLSLVNYAKNLHHIDFLYNLAHVADYEKPIFRRKTMMGGGCTILSIFVIAYLVVTLTLPFQLDNDKETRALVPNVSINNNVTADMYFNVTLSNYPMKCIADPKPGEIRSANSSLYPCVKEITVTPFAFGAPGPVGTAAPSSQACQKWYTNGTNTPMCTVIWYCHGCMTQGVLSNVTFSFLEVGTYAQKIYWGVNSTSGYPRQNSTLLGFMKAEDQLVFRGINPPSVISTKLTPTRHTTAYVSQTADGFGYTQFFIQQTPGSKVLPKNFNSYDGLVVTFAYENQLSTLDVTVDQKLTVPQYISQLLGSISGALAGLGLVMSIVEEIEDLFLSKGARDEDRKTQGTRGELEKLYVRFAEHLLNKQMEDEEKRKKKAGANSLGGKSFDNSVVDFTTFKRNWAMPDSNKNKSISRVNLNSTTSTSASNTMSSTEMATMNTISAAKLS